MTTRRPTRTWLIATLIVVIAAFVVVALREPLLRGAGWALVAGGPVAPADIIVISLDSGGAGALEAADLVKDGIARRVAVFAHPLRFEDQEFARRGLPDEDAGARQVRQLRALGVTDVIRIPAQEAGTVGEGRILPLWCAENHIRSVVFVAAKDHSRRVQRVLARTVDGGSVRLVVQPARYSSFDPDRWWTTRGNTRIAIIELQKLMLDVLLHPFSRWRPDPLPGAG